MTAGHKFRTILLLWASIGLSIWLLDGRFWVTLLLIAIAAGVTGHLLWIKTSQSESSALSPDEPAKI